MLKKENRNDIQKSIGQKHKLRCRWDVHAPTVVAEDKHGDAARKGPEVQQQLLLNTTNTL